MCVQVAQMKWDCHDWEDTPDTPQPVSPFSETGSSEQENATTTMHVRRFVLDECDGEDSIAETGSGLLPLTAGIVTKLYNSFLALRNSTVIPCAVEAFFIFLGGVVIATIATVSMIQQLWSQGTAVIAPGALMLWQGSCATLAATFANAKGHLSYFRGLLRQGWRWVNTPNVVFEFPIQAPADPTFYDQATVTRMIMSIKHEGYDEIDDEDTIMYGHDIYGYRFRNRTTIIKNRIRNLYWKLTAKQQVDYE